MPKTTQIYFGPAIGFYDELTFGEFVTVDVAQAIRNRGFEGAYRLGTLEEGKITRQLYSFQSARLSITRLNHLPLQRCSVDLIDRGADPKLLKIILGLLATEDKNPVNWERGFPKSITQ